METLSRRSISTSIACLFFLLSFGFWVQFLVRPSSPGPLLRAARFHTLGVWTWAVCGGGPALFGRLHQKLYLEAKRRPLFSDRVGLGWRSGGVIGSADVWQNHIGGGGGTNLRFGFLPGGGPVDFTSQGESKRLRGFGPHLCILHNGWGLDLGNTQPCEK